MGTGANGDEPEPLFVPGIDEHPVGFDMALPQTFRVPFERMVPVGRGERAAVPEDVDGPDQEGQVRAPSPHRLEVPLELGRQNQLVEEVALYNLVARFHWDVPFELSFASLVLLRLSDGPARRPVGIVCDPVLYVDGLLVPVDESGDRAHDYLWAFRGIRAAVRFRLLFAFRLNIRRPIIACVVISSDAGRVFCHSPGRFLLPSA